MHTCAMFPVFRSGSIQLGAVQFSAFLSQDEMQNSYYAQIVPDVSVGTKLAFSKQT